MSAQSSVYSALSSAAAVTAIVGTAIYPDEAPEDTDPPLVIHQAANIDPEYALDGALAFRRSIVSLTCWASTRAQANALADACAATLVSPTMRWSGRDDSVFDVDTGTYASVISVEVFESP